VTASRRFLLIRSPDRRFRIRAGATTMQSWGGEPEPQLQSRHAAGRIGPPIF
jgi:hypothetical protein